MRTGRYEARGKFGDHERCVRVARGVAERISSLLSAFQTSQVFHIMVENKKRVYYTHFEITGGPCNLIGSSWYDLFTHRTIFALNHIFFPANEEASLKTKQPIRF